MQKMLLKEWMVKEFAVQEFVWKLQEEVVEVAGEVEVEVAEMVAEGVEVEVI